MTADHGNRLTQTYFANFHMRPYSGVLTGSIAGYTRAHQHLYVIRF